VQHENDAIFGRDLLDDRFRPQEQVAHLDLANQVRVCLLVALTTNEQSADLTTAKLCINTVDRDGMNPGGQALDLSQLLGRADDLHEHLLHDVIVVVVRPEQPPDPAMNVTVKPVVDRGRRGVRIFAQQGPKTCIGAGPEFILACRFFRSVQCWFQDRHANKQRGCIPADSGRRKRSGSNILLAPFVRVAGAPIPDPGLPARASVAGGMRKPPARLVYSPWMVLIACAQAPVQNERPLGSGAESGAGDAGNSTAPGGSGHDGTAGAGGTAGSGSGGSSAGGAGRAGGTGGAGHAGSGGAGGGSGASQTGGAGTSGSAGGSGASSAANGGSSGTLGGSGGSPAGGAGTGGNVGGSGGSGGRTYSADRTTFFGPSRCDGFVFCESFETTDPGSLASGLTLGGYGTRTVGVVEDIAARGARSLRFEIPAQGAVAAWLTLPAPNGLGAAHFGRVFSRISSPAPEEFVHFDLFAGTGPYGGHSNEVRWASTGTGVGTAAGNWSFIYNVQPLGDGAGAEFGTEGDRSAHPRVEDWMCLEWSFDETEQVARFFVDGLPIEYLHIDDERAEIPVFATLATGFAKYQTTGAFVVHLDEIAFDSERIGCNN
jgi:hypothetical protein